PPSRGPARSPKTQADNHDADMPPGFGPSPAEGSPVRPKGKSGIRDAAANRPREARTSIRRAEELMRIEIAGGARPRSPQGRHVERIGRAETGHRLVGRGVLGHERRVADAADETGVLEEHVARPAPIPLVARLRAGADRPDSAAGLVDGQTGGGRL